MNDFDHSWGNVPWSNSLLNRERQSDTDRKDRQKHTQTLFLLAAVDDDILRHNTTLQHALFWVITTTSEQTWRLNLEVTNLLSVSINSAEAILSGDPLVLFLQHLSSARHQFTISSHLLHICCIVQSLKSIREQQRICNFQLNISYAAVTLK